MTKYSDAGLPAVQTRRPTILASLAFATIRNNLRIWLEQPAPRCAFASRSKAQKGPSAPDAFKGHRHAEDRVWTERFRSHFQGVRLDARVGKRLPRLKRFGLDRGLCRSLGSMGLERRFRQTESRRAPHGVVTDDRGRFGCRRRDRHQRPASWSLESECCCTWSRTGTTAAWDSRANRTLPNRETEWAIIRKRVRPVSYLLT